MLKPVVILAAIPLASLLDSDSMKFDPRRVVPPFPPITKVESLTVDEVKDEVTEAELVLGVVVGDEARAYSINMLTRPTREIINDVLGGRAIAATW